MDTKYKDNSPFHSRDVVTFTRMRFYENEKGKYYYDGLIDPSEAMTYGSLVHLKLLENKRFERNAALYKSILAEGKLYPFEASIENLLKNKVHFNFLKGKIREKLLKFTIKTDSKKEIKCESTIDLVNEKGWLVDLKTTNSLEELKYSIYKYRYDMQLSFYKKACEENDIQIIGVAILGIEKSIPHESHVFLLSDDTLERGEFGDDKVRGWRQIAAEMVFNPQRRFQDEFTLI